MKICIICPVRNGVPEEVTNYVSQQEAGGNKVHFPPRDNPQSDPIGNVICETMKRAIAQADEVHIFYTSESQGTHFDLGMAFALGKRLVLINNPQDRDGKSYIKVIKSRSVNSE